MFRLSPNHNIYTLEEYYEQMIKIKDDESKQDTGVSKTGQAYNQTSFVTNNILDNTQKVNSLTPERDLVAYHNMSEDSVLRSAALGGLPVPSIAITKKDIPFTQFGKTTLIGGGDIIDPARRGNDVYSQDAWTTTFPEIVHDRIKIGDIRNFRDTVI